jgi:CRP/FNR family transcriptional regulator, cyclic AMP receptor protein
MAPRIPRRKQRIAALREVALFARCSDAELGRIASLATEHVAKAGDVLTEKDDPGLEFFVIVDGAATVTRNGVKLATLGGGSFFGELAMLNGATRTATVAAKTDMRLLVLSRREFNSLHHAAPSIAEKMLAELGARLRSTDDMLDFAPALAAGL